MSALRFMENLMRFGSSMLIFPSQDFNCHMHVILLKKSGM